MGTRKKVAIGLSGGVDSSVAAYLLVEQGYEVTGFTLKFFPQKNRCCDLDSLYQAQRLCDSLNIAHYTLDAGEVFKKEIIDYFIRSYRDALTPNPCAYCNRLVKFGYFFEKIKALNIDYLATGHYACLDKLNGNLVFKKNKDKKKTQEYFLSLVKPSILPQLIFPLWQYSKDQVKAIARDKKIIFSAKKESQDVCFINGSTYPNFIEEHSREQVFVPGAIIHIDGKILGRHKGIHHYTYGQRSGLGIGWREPLYVVGIETESATLIVAERERLYRRDFSVSSLNYFCDLKDFSHIAVKVRYNSPEVGCSLSESGSGLKVKLNDEIAGIAPGQVAAFYYKDAVIGAGIIEKFSDV
jgi:tRNA-uridine 2-sulfurtransferase